MQALHTYSFKILSAEMVRTRIHYMLLLTMVVCMSSCKEPIPEPITPVEVETKKATGLQMFMPGEISTELYERDFTILREGNEIIYTLGSITQDRRMLVSRKKMESGFWSDAEALPFSGTYHDIEPFYDPESNRLFFASNRPLTALDSVMDYNLWYCELKKNKWGTPTALPGVINSDKDEFYPSVSKSGNLYFTATRPDGPGLEDIYVSHYKAGAYQEPVALDTTVNSSTYDFNAYINPEETLIVFSSYGREDDLGGGDLYLSFRKPDSSWASAIHLQAPINSKALDYCPYIDYDKRIFYFTSERMIDTLKPPASPKKLLIQAHKPGNGLGDIYSIPMDSVVVDR